MKPDQALINQKTNQDSQGEMAATQEKLEAILRNQGYVIYCVAGRSGLTRIGSPERARAAMQ